jgi:hypothetical protein
LVGGFPCGDTPAQVRDEQNLSDRLFVTCLRKACCAHRARLKVLFEHFLRDWVKSRGLDVKRKNGRECEDWNIFFRGFLSLTKIELAK